MTAIYHGGQPTGRLLATGSYKSVTDELKANGFLVNFQGIYGKEGKVISLRRDHANNEWHAFSNPGDWSSEGAGNDYRPSKGSKRKRVRL